MPQSIVVLLGDLPVGTPAIQAAAAEFGWSIKPALDLDHLRRIARSNNLVAVLFHPEGFGITHAQMLEAVRDVAPSARCIPCHRFSDPVNWPDLAEAGAFHALALPLKADEVRQSLGFVWSARLLQSSKVVPMRRPAVSETERHEIEELEPDNLIDYVTLPDRARRG